MALVGGDAELCVVPVGTGGRGLFAPNGGVPVVFKDVVLFSLVVPEGVEVEANK